MGVAEAETLLEQRLLSKPSFIPWRQQRISFALIGQKRPISFALIGQKRPIRQRETFSTMMMWKAALCCKTWIGEERQKKGERFHMANVASALQRRFSTTCLPTQLVQSQPYEWGLIHSSGAVWESRWPSWAVRPNEPYGFRGRKAILNHAHALVSACP